jgi:hypothetical protein
MAHYYFDIRRAGDLIADEEGLEFGDISDAMAEALASARELAAEAIQDQRNIDGDRIEVRDASGKASFTVPIIGVVR